jgi:hypothetical protein
MTKTLATRAICQNLEEEMKTTTTTTTNRNTTTNLFHSHLPPCLLLASSTALQHAHTSPKDDVSLIFLVRFLFFPGSSTSLWCNL